MEGEGKGGGNKWDKIENQFVKEEKIENLEKKDFGQEVSDNIHKMMGCSKDHAAEIDIYNKTFKEKIERIKMMKEQGNIAIGEYNKKPDSDDLLNKASYYYA